MTGQIALDGMWRAQIVRFLQEPSEDWSDLSWSQATLSGPVIRYIFSRYDHLCFVKRKGVEESWWEKVFKLSKIILCIHNSNQAICYEHNTHYGIQWFNKSTAKTPTKHREQTDWPGPSRCSCLENPSWRNGRESRTDFFLTKPLQHLPWENLVDHTGSVSIWDWINNWFVKLLLLPDGNKC